MDVCAKAHGTAPYPSRQLHLVNWGYGAPTIRGIHLPFPTASALVSFPRAPCTPQPETPPGSSSSAATPSPWPISPPPPPGTRGFGVRVVRPRSRGRVIHDRGPGLPQRPRLAPWRVARGPGPDPGGRRAGVGPAHREVEDGVTPARVRQPHGWTCAEDVDGSI
jgi:hypothetical protein